LANKVKEKIESDKITTMKINAGKVNESRFEKWSAMEYTVSYPYTLFATTDERLETFRKFGTRNVYVSLPAVVGAKMCVEEQAIKGIIGPECLGPLEFLKGMAAMGCPVKFDEVISRGVVIT